MEKLRLNQCATGTVEGYSSEGLGIVRLNGAVVFVPRAVRGEEIELREDDDDDEIVYTDSGRENLVTDENEVLSSGYGIDADSEAKQGLDALEKIIGIDDDEEEEDPEPECPYDISDAPEDEE